jgi:Domain of unknown function (DUF4832)
MTRRTVLTCALAATVLCGLTLLGDTKHPLAYAQAPVDNPLKGLVPYQADVRSRFPHSLEFNYVAYASLVKGYTTFDWAPLERMLDDIASRGHQAVFRIYLEYPNKKRTIPDFLIRDGLKVHTYLNTNTQPFPPSEVETPDYEDPNLRRSLQSFIAALGRKYDGDPRIGFITAGLLGTWGEWHTHPRNELFASKVVQTEVLDAYEAAFKTTPILLRYPSGTDDARKAPNAERNFGYHDDSFAWATLATGRKQDNWFYMAALKAAGPAAESRWKTHPIGGEIRPEAWGKVFDENPEVPQIQDFAKCVEATHASWLMDSGMFRTQQEPERIRRAADHVRRMGYEFHCPTVTLGNITDRRLSVFVEVENRGVAPFYAPWKSEFALLKDGKTVWSTTTTNLLTGILPGGQPRRWTQTLNLSEVQPGTYTLALRVPNPLPTGNPVRFANATQDADTPGWLSLAPVNIVP